MSPRTTGLLLLVALALGAFVYLYEVRGPGPGGDPAASADDVFPGLEAAEIAWLEIATTDGVVARAERTADGWRLVEPGAWRADVVALDGVASQLAGLDVQGRASGGAAADEFGLAGETPAVRFEAGGVERALRIGGRTPVGSNTYVQAGRDGEVVWVSTWRTNALRKSLTELRDRRVLDFDHSAIERVTVQWPSGGIEAERLGDGWRLIEPVEERADRATIETLLSDLAFLRADGFIDEGLEDEASGLAEPVLRVTLEAGGDVDAAGPLALVFGATRDEQRIVRGAGASLFLIDEERLEDVPREVLAYRFKALGDFDPADARGLELAFGADASSEHAPPRFETRLAAGRWQIPADRPVSEARVREMVAALSRLSAIAIVAESVGDHELAALGLAPPRVMARVTGEGGVPLAEIAFGAVQAGRGVLAQRADSPILYRVDPTVSERLPTDAADFDARFLGEDDPPEEAEEPWVPELDDDDEIPEESRPGGPLGAVSRDRDGRLLGPGGATAQCSPDRLRHAARGPHVALRRVA